MSMSLALESVATTLVPTSYVPTKKDFSAFIDMIELSLLFEHWKRKLGCALDNIITVPRSFQS